MVEATTQVSEHGDSLRPILCQIVRFDRCFCHKNDKKKKKPCN